MRATRNAKREGVEWKGRPAATVCVLLNTAKKGKYYPDLGMKHFSLRTRRFSTTLFDDSPYPFSGHGNDCDDDDDDDGALPNGARRTIIIFSSALLSIFAMVNTTNNVKERGKDQAKAKRTRDE